MNSENENLIEIYGGVPLRGSVQVSGAKNGVLPMMVTALLTDQPCQLSNVPALHDVYLTSELIRHLGGEVDPRDAHQLRITVPSLIASEASYSIVRSLRASFWVLAPLLARGGAARVAMPGGDVIGARPVDIHLESLSKMGADIKVKGGVVAATAVNGLKPAELDFHFPSVGATHQVLLAASLTKGQTVIRNAAREPEVVALGNCLIEMGAKIEGLGTSEIVINGVSELGGYSQSIPGDRIEAATYLFGAAATNGNVEVRGFDPEHLGGTIEILKRMGMNLEPLEGVSGLRASRGRDTLSPVEISTGPFPEFATDNQALLIAALTLAKGESTVTETVYEGRFGHLSELSRLGAKIQLSGQTATITGVSTLTGATVEARDIRAGAAMVIAGLAASGRTVIEESHHLRRGYECLEEKLRKLGARIVGTSDDEDELHLVGC